MSRKSTKPTAPLRARCTVSAEDLRAHVRAWPKERLADLVLDGIERDVELRERVEREIVRERGGGPAAARLKADVDRVLDIDFVEEREVATYCARLDGVLGSIVSLGKTEPSATLPVAWHFVEALPRILDSVHCEDELGIFCGDLAKATLSLATRVSHLGASGFSVGRKRCTLGRLQGGRPCETSSCTAICWESSFRGPSRR